MNTKVKPIIKAKIGDKPYHQGLGKQGSYGIGAILGDLAVETGARYRQNEDPLDPYITAKYSGSKGNIKGTYGQYGDDFKYGKLNALLAVNPNHAVTAGTQFNNMTNGAVDPSLGYSYRDRDFSAGLNAILNREGNLDMRGNLNYKLGGNSREDELLRIQALKGGN